ncbi:MAG: F0F1 ATP synthase subunit B [Candidatus Omnitrophica bacterium]|nr:F0F1 ATP synthase subunit B [Candidatus Omnitrophota bacterium]
MELFKLLNGNIVVAQIICFFLILWLLKKFLWKPVFAIIDERKARIDGELKTIESTKADVVRLKSEYESFIAKVEELAQKRIHEAELQSEARAQEMREKARQEAEQIVEDARNEIRFEFTKSRDLLRGDIVEMVIKVTEKLIQEKLTFDTDRKLVENMLVELEKGDER